MKSALHLGLALFATTLAAPHWLWAAFTDMSQKLPADTNAVVAINLERLLDTPLAQQEHWKTKWSDAFEAGPTFFPPGTTRALVGAQMMPNLRETKWQISMMELTRPIPLQEIARAEGGYTDKLLNNVAVVSPNGIYFVQINPTTLAGVEPADRRFALRWLSPGSVSKGPSSPFLQSTITSLGASTQVLIAMDLADNYSPSDIRKAMDDRPLQSLADKGLNLDTLSHLIAGIQSLTVSLECDKDIRAHLVAEFDMDAALLETCGKPLTIEIMDRAGLSFPDMQNWTAKVSGKQFYLDGDLTTQGLRHLLSVIGMPAPAATNDPALAKASDDPAVIGDASKRYFKAVSNIIDSFAGQASYTETRAWLVREAQTIDRLPILNVDPELTAWGGEVSSRMRQVAAMLASDQQTATAKVQGIANPAASYYVDHNGNRGNYHNNRGYASNVQAYNDWQRQRAQALSEQKAKSTKEAADMMGTLTADRGKIRATMTQKYQTQF